MIISFRQKEKLSKPTFMSSIFFLIIKIGEIKEASLVAQLVKKKSLPAMQETPVWFLGQEYPLEKR